MSKAKIRRDALEYLGKKIAAIVGTAGFMWGISVYMEFSRAESLILVLIALFVVFSLRIDALLDSLIDDVGYLVNPETMRNGGEKIDDEKEDRIEETTGFGAFVGMVIGGLIGLPFGAGGVVIGGLLGAIIGNEMESESVREKRKRRYKYFKKINR